MYEPNEQMVENLKDIMENAPTPDGYTDMFVIRGGVTTEITDDNVWDLYRDLYEEGRQAFLKKLEEKEKTEEGLSDMDKANKEHAENLEPPPEEKPDKIGKESVRSLANRLGAQFGDMIDIDTDHEFRPDEYKQACREYAKHRDEVIEEFKQALGEHYGIDDEDLLDGYYTLCSTEVGQAKFDRIIQKFDVLANDPSLWKKYEEDMFAEIFPPDPEPEEEEESKEDDEPKKPSFLEA